MNALLNAHVGGRLVAIIAGANASRRADGDWESLLLEANVASRRCGSTKGGANPSLTIMAVACRIGDHIAAIGKRGDLH